MTLAYPLLARPLSFTENRINLLVIENRGELRRFLFSLRDQIDGLPGELVLGKNGEILEMSKNAILITDPFSLDFESRKLLTKITQDACSAGNEYAEELHSLMVRLNEIAMKISRSLGYDAAFEPVDSFDELIKILNFHIDREEMSFPESLLEYMKLQRLFFNKKLFVFYNLKACLSMEELNLFYKSVFYEKLDVLLVEDTQRRESLPCESCIIIDKDLCVF